MDHVVAAVRTAAKYGLSTARSRLRNCPVDLQPQFLSQLSDKSCAFFNSMSKIGISCGMCAARLERGEMLFPEQSEAFRKSIWCSHLESLWRP